jgi:hypothetical protein
VWVVPLPLAVLVALVVRNASAVAVVEVMDRLVDKENAGDDRIGVDTRVDSVVDVVEDAGDNEDLLEEGIDDETDH